jgi:RNA polymerase sigma factor (sigma-70 family)
MQQSAVTDLHMDCLCRVSHFPKPITRLKFSFQPEFDCSILAIWCLRVKRDDSSWAAVPEKFRTTRWSVVLAAAQSQAPGSKEALAELCKLYWYPIYGYVRRRGHKPHDAQDITQSFFVDLLEYKALARVNRQKGKFRSFLLASLQNCLSNEAQRARCLKRGGKIEFVAIDADRAEERYRLEPVDTLTPEKIFDARWAMALLAEAKNRLGNEYRLEGKDVLFEPLKAFLDPVNAHKLPSYEEVADQLQMSVAAVKTLIHRMRKRYSALVREEVLRTVSDIADAEAEIHDLCDALIAAEGWILP